MIDSHAHINHEDFIKNVDSYISDSKKAKVDFFLCVGWDLNSSILATKIANNYSNIWACIGIHPNDVQNVKKKDFKNIEILLKTNKKIIAIGEVGLDFFFEKDKNKQRQQKEYFVKFINLANKYELPLVLHARNANNETLNILKKYQIKNGGVLHCYSMGPNYVKEFLKLGFYFGIGGVVTFKKAESIVESVKVIPIDRLLLETDAPYLTPEPFRGKKNHSKYLSYILEKIAMIKNVKKEELDHITNNNFKKLFRVNV